MLEDITPRSLGLKPVREIRVGDKIDLKDSPILVGCPCGPCDRATEKANAGGRFQVKKVTRLEFITVTPELLEEIELLDAPGASEQIGQRVPYVQLGDVIESLAWGIFYSDFLLEGEYMLECDTYSFPVKPEQYLSVD